MDLLRQKTALHNDRSRTNRGLLTMEEESIGALSLTPSSTNQEECLVGGTSTVVDPRAYELTDSANYVVFGKF